MFKVESDALKNRLFITLEDLSPDDIKPILADLTHHTSELKQGFSCLVDIRKMSLNPGTKGEEYIEIVQGALADTGMGKVVRIVDKNNDHHHHRMEESSTGLGYTTHPVYTLEEAERILDGAN
ncbi:hypothetical protein JCM14469_06920 [Desulfatiferula olefinivorans]